MLPMSAITTVLRGYCGDASAAAGGLRRIITLVVSPRTRPPSSTSTAPFPFTKLMQLSNFLREMKGAALRLIQRHAGAGGGDEG